MPKSKRLSRNWRQEKDFEQHGPYVPSRRLPARPGNEPTIARSGWKCEITTIRNYDYVKEKMERHNIIAKYLLMFKLDDVKNTYFIDFDVLSEYFQPMYLNKLIYFTFLTTSADYGHVIGGFIFRNDLGHIFVFLFNGYPYDDKKLADDIRKTLLMALSHFTNNHDLIHISLYPIYDNEYEIQTDWSNFKSPGECQTFSIIIPILMAKSVNFNLLKHETSFWSLLQPSPVQKDVESVLDELDYQIELVYYKYNNMSLSLFNEAQREVGLLGGR